MASFDNVFLKMTVMTVYSAGGQCIAHRKESNVSLWKCLYILGMNHENALSHR
jgi:hypothetical protein